MKVKNHLEFRRFDYISTDEETIYNLGDVVIGASDDNQNEIGVVIQVHDEFELRTDMFGNASINEIRIATIDEVETYRPELISKIVAQD